MLDKLRDNPRAVVAVLITAGVIALFVGGGTGDNGAVDTVKTEEATTSQAAESEEVSDEVSSTVENGDVAIGSEPQAGPVKVEKTETAYKSIIRAGDNQTVIARQMVNDYLGTLSQSLSAEQRLYVETVVVDSLPRNDLVFAGDEIEVSGSFLAEAVSDSGNLTKAQIAAWSAYL